MSIKSTILAVAALAASAHAHIIMEKPVPFSVDKIDNSPISAAQYPCKSQNGFTVSTMNNMKVGEKQSISFKGTAVHGGGSCQLSITTDKTPTANSKFKVIKSMEGGCPGLDGKPTTYDFTLPDSIPNGQVTFAWTWFSKQAGQPELYMNCAPVTVSGGASDASKMDALPDMLIANINDCKQVENKAIKFPNPGSEVQNGNTNDLAPPTGNCGKSGGSTGGGGAGGASSAAGGGGAATSAAGGGGGAATSAAGGVGASSAVATPTSVAGGAPSVSPPASSNTGGVFAPGASSGSGEQPQSTLTTLVTTTATPPSQGTGAPTTPSTGGGSGTCSQNGAIVCNGDSQFGICNFGTVVWQPVASGTKCSNGSVQKREYKLRRRNHRPRRVVPGKDFQPDN